MNGRSVVVVMVARNDDGHCGDCAQCVGHAHGDDDDDVVVGDVVRWVVVVH